MWAGGHRWSPKVREVFGIEGRQMVTSIEVDPPTGQPRVAVTGAAHLGSLLVTAAITP